MPEFNRLDQIKKNLIVRLKDQINKVFEYFIICQNFTSLNFYLVTVKKLLCIALLSFTVLNTFSFLQKLLPRIKKLFTKLVNLPRI